MPKPFDTEIRDRVVISKGLSSSEPVDLIVTYNKLAPDQIRGTVLGTQAASQQLQEVQRDTANEFVRIRSVSSERRRLRSATAILRRVTGSLRSSSDENIQGASREVATLELEDVWIDEHVSLPPPAGAERRVSFNLPEDFDLASPLLSRSFLPDAYRLERLPEAPYDLGREGCFLADSSVLEYEDTTDRVSKRVLVAEVPVLTFVARRPPEEYGDVEFLSDATADVEDFLLLASFVAKRAFRWLSRSSPAPHGWTTLVRGGQLADTGGPDPSDNRAAQRRHELRQSAKEAVASLRRRRDLGAPLDGALHYFIAAQQARATEERFFYAVSALEMLLDQFGRSQDLSRVFKRKDFDEVKKRLGATIDEAVADLRSPAAERLSVNSAALLRMKLDELNRPTLEALLRECLKEYGVSWEDLYPEGTKAPTLIGARNKLIHASNKPTPTVLVREALRTSAICERLLRKLLGWTGDAVPGGQTRSWLLRPDDKVQPLE